MVILGLWDGPEGGAAVVIDDRVVSYAQQAALLGVHQTAGFPWEAIAASLDAAGVSPSDVRKVAVAGQLSPARLARRQPGLRGLLSAPFGPALDAVAITQALLRHSGLGAWEADAEAERVRADLAERGFAPNVVRTVDLHRALAEAAYRLQPEDEALVVTLHPFGDGSALAVHLGRAGQLDRVYVQGGFEALHVHLVRVTAALGLRPEIDEGALWSLAARGTPDAALSELLDRALRAEGGSLSRRVLAGPEQPDHAVLARLRELAPEDAAATVADNLARVVSSVVAHHAAAADVSTVALAGRGVADSRLVARVAARTGLRLHVLPDPGGHTLALGAAVGEAGIVPQRIPLHAGPRVAGAAEALVRSGGLPCAREAAVRRLVAGEAFLRVAHRPGPGVHGLGDRAVLVRADDREAVARAREALGRHTHLDPLVVALPSVMPSDRCLSGPLVLGTAAPRVPSEARAAMAGALAPDGRVPVLRATADTHADLHDLLRAVRAAGGPGALAALPVAEGDGAVPADADHAVEIWRRAGFGALQLGDGLVERGA